MITNTRCLTAISAFSLLLAVLLAVFAIKSHSWVSTNHERIEQLEIRCEEISTQLNELQNK